jgi:hypothetical protein
VILSRTPGIRLALLTLLIATAPCSVDAQLSLERDVKAAFLVNFAIFTEWPAGTFADSAEPIVIGVVGNEMLRRTIDHIARGKLFSGRELKTRHVQDANDVAHVHLLFIAGSMGPGTAEILQAVNGLPVLTVGDAAGFCAAGGMIAFLLERDRLRFEIRFDATEHAGLKVSSRVLVLAQTVHGKK